MTIARRLARWLYRLLAAIGLITVLAISTPIVSWWARAYSGSIDQPRGDVLILLSAAADDANGISYSSYWRARMAVLAWKTGSFKTVVVSGRSGPGILNFLVAEGVPRKAIITESRSTSTRENALDTAGLIRNMPGKKVLLTSDFHMYRAIRVFRKVGITVTPMAVPDVLHDTQNWSGRFSGFEIMLIETAKIAYYRLRGWIVF
jgi:uncharacterized SAM-binding protein YcdF (DUF218 family)